MSSANKQEQEPADPFPVPGHGDRHSRDHDQRRQYGRLDGPRIRPRNRLQDADEHPEAGNQRALG